jgi:hypothetical protein
MPGKRPFVSGEGGRCRPLGSPPGDTSSLTSFSEFELKGGGGNQSCHFSAAFGTFFERVIGKLSLHFEPDTTGVTLVFIDGHC